MRINYAKVYLTGNKQRLPFPRLTGRAGVSKKDVDNVCKYILDQPDHHKKTFAEGYERFMRHYQKTLKWDIR